MKQYLLALGFSLAVGCNTGDLEKKVEIEDSIPPTPSAGVSPPKKPCEDMRGFDALQKTYNTLKERLTKVDLLNTPVRRNYNRAEKQYKDALGYRQESCKTPHAYFLAVRLAGEAVQTMTEAVTIRDDIKAIVLSGMKK